MPPATPESEECAQNGEDPCDPTEWPTPKWYSETSTARPKTYEDYFALQLRARYTELELDYRTIVDREGEKIYDRVGAERLRELLQAIRMSLEQQSGDLLTLSHALNLASQQMVWFYPSFMLPAKREICRQRLEDTSIAGREWFVKMLTELEEPENDSGEERALLAATMDEATRLANRREFEEWISRGLQINRLKLLRSWGLIVLLGFFAVVPLATKVDSDRAAWTLDESLRCWAKAIAVVAFGAVGGFISGLRQARNTRVLPAEYLESMVRLELRPLVGALVALILFTLLSWGVLPGVAIESPGSYFLVAFLSGFSERYFLRLLKTEPESESLAHPSSEQSSAAHAVVRVDTAQSQEQGARN